MAYDTGLPRHQLKCHNPNCNFLVHSSLESNGFCCGRCWGRFSGVMRGRVAHGEWCERRPAPDNFRVAPYIPTAEDQEAIDVARQYRTDKESEKQEQTLIERQAPPPLHCFKSIERRAPSTERQPQPLSFFGMERPSPGIERLPPDLHTQEWSGMERLPPDLHPQEWQQAVPAPPPKLMAGAERHPGPPPLHVDSQVFHTPASPSNSGVRPPPPPPKPTAVALPAGAPQPPPPKRPAAPKQPPPPQVVQHATWSLASDVPADWDSPHPINDLVEEMQPPAVASACNLHAGLDDPLPPPPAATRIASAWLPPPPKPPGGQPWTKPPPPQKAPPCPSRRFADQPPPPPQKASCPARGSSSVPHPPPPPKPTSVAADFQERIVPPPPPHYQRDSVASKARSPSVEKLYLSPTPGTSSSTTTPTLPDDHLSAATTEDNYTGYFCTGESNDKPDLRYSSCASAKWLDDK